MRQSNPYPRISQAIRLLVLFVALQLAFGLLLGLLGGVLGYPLHRHPAAVALLSLVAASLVLLWGLKRTRASLREVFPLVPIRISLLLPITLTIIGAHILLSEMDNLLRTVLPMPAWLADFFTNLTQAETSLWGSALALVVVAPLTEELLFRGLILRGFLTNYTVRKAVVASAILFAVVHLNPWQAPTAALLGVLLAWWFVETRSLLPCLFGHALANALPLICATVLPVKIPGFTGGLSTQVEFQPLWFDLLGALLVGLGIWLLVQRFREADDTPAQDPVVEE